MSRLDELIQELCPDGVEYKTIQEVCVNICSGGTPKTSISDYYGGDIPWVRTQEVDWDYIYDTDVKITEEGLDNSSAKWIPSNCIIVAMYGATAAKVAINKIPVTTNQACCNLEINENIVLLRYVYHFLCNEYENLKGMGQGSQSNINAQMIKSYRIPVPPLEVQREIVRILDSFTLLTAELTAELTARKRQYEFYRDDLLAFNSDIPMVTLGDIATDIYRGSGIKRDEVTEDGIPCVRYGEIYTQYNTWFDECVSHTQLEYVSTPKYFEHGDILFAITGESVEDIAKSVAYLGHEKCLAGGDIVVLKHEQDPRYLAHVLATYEARKQKSKGKIKSKVVHSSVPAIKEIAIPLPPLDVQKRYADVLDNFEKICFDLNIGLPAEIEARQKQYEYYRDALLTYAATGKIIVQTDRQTDRQTNKRA